MRDLSLPRANRLRVAVQKMVNVVRPLLRDASEDRVNGLAAEVAFFAVLSVFPGLLVFAAALGSLEAVTGGTYARDVEIAVVDFLREILTERAAATVDAVQELFESGSGGIATVATFLAVVSLSRAFAAVIRSLDLAYDVEERRPWIRLRLLAVGAALATVAMAAIVFAAVVVGPLLGSGRAVADRFGLGGVFEFAWSWLRWPAAALLLVGWAVGSYRLLPNRKTTWRQNLPGAIFAASGWLLASLGLSAYLRLAGAANPVFGILGGGLILLVWLYLLALALLLGAELNGVLERRGRPRERPEPVI